jgi:hypothetical protein
MKEITMDEILAERQAYFLYEMVARFKAETGRPPTTIAEMTDRWWAKYTPADLVAHDDWGHWVEARELQELETRPDAGALLAEALKEGVRTWPKWREALRSLTPAIRNALKRAHQNGCKKVCFNGVSYELSALGMIALNEQYAEDERHAEDDAAWEDAVWDDPNKDNPRFVH